MPKSEQSQQVEVTLRRLISGSIGSKPEDIIPDLPLLEVGVDSFELMKLLVEIENIFGITMSEEDLMDSWMDSLQDIIGRVEKLLA